MADLFDILLGKNLAGGVQPQGEIEITENGEYDVTEYASASVDVPSPFPVTVTFMNGTEEWAKVGTKNDKITINAPTQPSKSGYHFLGWKDSNDNFVTFPYTPTENITLIGDFAEGGYIFYAPLGSDEQAAATGQTLVKNGNNFTFETDSGVPCCAFNGSYYTVPSFTDIAPNQPCTFSLWLKSPNANNKIALSYGNDFYCLAFGVGSSNELFSILYPSGASTLFQGATNDNKWHHFAFTHDGSSASFYIDGTLVTTKSVTSRFDNYGLCIGTLAGVSTLKFGGKVASVKIFDIVLESEAIAQLAAEFTPTDR